MYELACVLIGPTSLKWQQLARKRDEAYESKLYFALKIVMGPST